jgi:hypothetical protein
MRSSVDIPVSVPMDLGEDSPLVVGVVAKMRAGGLVISCRTAPFSIPEMEGETGLKKSQIYRMIEAGTFERCGGVGKVLVKVPSVRRWQGFSEGGKK